MLESYLRRTPLSHLGLVARAQPAREENAGVTMGEVPFRGLVNLRLDPKTTALKSAAEAVLGLSLPTTVGDTAEGKDAKVLTTGPDEWLIVSPDGPAMAEKLAKTAEGKHIAVTDISENWTTIRVAGPATKALLAKGCALDFHETKFPVGHCAQSMIAKADLTIVRLEDSQDGPTYDLTVRISFAEYVWLWLEDAAREYGLTVLDHS